ncbi:MAG: hypothetical protein IKD23_00915 [Lentisphaeria bacterium]|nr:hypothetical protein [Lentisphaeria bacterium]
MSKKFCSMILLALFAGFINVQAAYISETVAKRLFREMAKEDNGPYGPKYFVPELRKTDAFVFDWWKYADDKVDEGDWAGGFDVHKVIKDKCSCRILGSFQDKDSISDGYDYMFVMVEKDDGWLIAEVFRLDEDILEETSEIQKFDFTSGEGKFKKLSAIDAVVAQRYFKEW